MYSLINYISKNINDTTELLHDLTDIVVEYLHITVPCCLFCTKIGSDCCTIKYKIPTYFDTYIDEYRYNNHYICINCLYYNVPYNKYYNPSDIHTVYELFKKFRFYYLTYPNKYVFLFGSIEKNINCINDVIKLDENYLNNVFKNFSFDEITFFIKTDMPNLLIK